MPPWAVSAPRTMSLQTCHKPIDRLSHHLLRCSNVSSLTRHTSLLRAAGRRNTSTSTSTSTNIYVSPTAINARPRIPLQNQELYIALSKLSVTAERYVNISRVQLALRGLAVEDAVTRVAVLSLNSQLSAQKLARLLVADPLAEIGSWEKELQSSGDGGMVLLRYGDESETIPSPLYKMYQIPSRVLQKHNLEILVSTLNVDVSDMPAASTSESSKEAVLVPKLQATSARGLPVPYPVHRTLVLGEGIESAVAFGRFTADANGDLDDMVRVAFELPAPAKEDQPDAEGSSSAVNVEVGEEALNVFRESIANAVKYEQGWYKSGLPGLSQWLIQGLEKESTIKPVMKRLISSIVDDVEATVTKEDVQRINKLTASRTPEQSTAVMINHLEEWAEKSHAELRDELDEAFAARNWHKISWWKLFWRVDDVGMITSEILERRWLVSAEKTAVYLAGRMNQAGYPETIAHLTPPATHSYTPSDDPASPVVPPPETPHPSANEQLDISTEVTTPQPWPTQISTSRSNLMNSTVPPLQALAQRLVLTTLSTTSLTAALSSLLYVSVPTFSVFEASTIGALGLVFSLRHMQKVWENTREAWRGEVSEQGRKTLKVTEEEVRAIIKGYSGENVGRSSQDEGVKERKAARDAISKVRDVLEKL